MRLYLKENVWVKDKCNNTFLSTCTFTVLLSQKLRYKCCSGINLGINV